MVHVLGLLDDALCLRAQVAGPHGETHAVAVNLLGISNKRIFGTFSRFLSDL